MNPRSFLGHKKLKDQKYFRVENFHFDSNFSDSNFFGHKTFKDPEIFFTYNFIFDPNIFTQFFLGFQAQLSQSLIQAEHLRL